MLQTHHMKYDIITFSNFTDIVPDFNTHMSYYTHDPKVEIQHWLPFNLANYYESHLAEWVIVKTNMCSLNQVDPSDVPVAIIVDRFIDSHHPKSRKMFSNLEAFFNHIGTLGDSSQDSSLFVNHDSESEEE